MRQNAVMFQAAGLNFEGVVAEPDDAPRPVPGILICHPGPLNGGNMDNNVVTAVSAALTQQGFATIRFNFRGVGNSQGEHSHGELEHEEALAALDFLKAWPGVDGETLGMVGYSFGNRVILGSGGLQKEPRAFAFPVSASTPALVLCPNAARAVTARPPASNLPCRPCKDGHVLITAGDQASVAPGATVTPWGPARLVGRPPLYLPPIYIR